MWILVVKSMLVRAQYCGQKKNEEEGGEYRKKKKKKKKEEEKGERGERFLERRKVERV